MLNIETVMLFCPHCKEFYVDATFGNDYLPDVSYDEHTYNELSNVLKCFTCGEKFRKPVMRFWRNVG